MIEKAVGVVCGDFGPNKLGLSIDFLLLFFYYMQLWHLPLA